MKVNRIFRASWDHSAVEINSVPAGVYRGTKPSHRTERVASRRVASHRFSSRRIALASRPSYLNGKVSARSLSPFLRLTASLLSPIGATVERTTYYGKYGLREAAPGPCNARKITANYRETGEREREKDRI